MRVLVLIALIGLSFVGMACEKTIREVHIPAEPALQPQLAQAPDAR
jgi:hypothetical protein